MQVIVKPHHLRGNNWSHGAERRCPLQEALVEAGHKNSDVGAWSVKIDREFYQIPVVEWNSDTVPELIKAADEGSDKEYTITFIDKEEFGKQMHEVLKRKEEPPLVTSN